MPTKSKKSAAKITATKTKKKAPRQKRVNELQADPHTIVALMEVSKFAIREFLRVTAELNPTITAAELWEIQMDLEQEEAYIARGKKKEPPVLQIKKWKKK